MRGIILTGDKNMQEKVNILGVEFDNRTKQATIDVIHQNIKEEKKTFIVTANPEIVMYALQDQNYMDTMRKADHIIADGAGIILAAKMLKDPLPERVAGFDLMKDLLHIADQDKLTVFFLGSKEEVIKQTVANVAKDYPNLIIGGYHHGFFKENDHRVRDMVKNAKADLIFVALGYPRQENWIMQNKDLFEKGIFMGVGGSFDILAGTVKRAPLIWQKLNIEWLYRLIQQPTRWKRMFAIPLFIKKVIQYKKRKN